MVIDELYDRACLRPDMFATGLMIIVIYLVRYTVCLYKKIIELQPVIYGQDPLYEDLVTGGGGGGNIHIFMFCLINICWNPLFLQSEHERMNTPPPTNYRFTGATVSIEYWFF